MPMLLLSALMFGMLQLCQWVGPQLNIATKQTWLLGNLKWLFTWHGSYRDMAANLTLQGCLFNMTVNSMGLLTEHGSYLTTYGF